MKSYDVVVIGAGNGGLTAACKVLKEGKTCLLVERHNIPGGFATSFVRGPFEFEASLHELNSIGPDPINNPGTCAKVFLDLDVLKDIDFIQIKNCYRLIVKKEGIDFTMPIGIDEIIKRCKDVCPDGDKHAREFLELCKNCSDAIGYFGNCGGKPDIEVLKSKYSGYMSMGEYTVNEVYDAIKLPTKLRAIFSGYWSYLGCHFDELNFSHFANMIFKYFRDGAVVPTKRSHEMSLALENRIHELGGDIYFKTEATKILTDKEGHVSGVKLQDGKVIPTKHVIANTSPHNVYSKMMDNVPAKALKLTNFRKLGGRGFTIFLGLNKSPEELGIADHSYFIYDSSDSVITHKMMEDINHIGGQATVCLNHVVPNYAPKGKTILYITTLFTSDCWSKVKETEYFKKKNEIAARFIKQFEDALNINIHDYIEEIAVATPETYARYCAHPQGVIYGYRAQNLDNIMARAQMIKEDNVVPGLRFGGGYGERSLGFSSSYVSGFKEAVRTLKDIESEETN